ncbi:class I SAM-dependent methyltransferase [Aureitalea marina]|uniref:SAM-dependent methyltransferase n=1 Tax=Aureitalea marina TaxID=930804 RepID=A0A2S7KTY7_9FLAO|nr:class I SAM-dependent methyltransferase [Aureitalea marina]PQB06095.1 SAM-dependent methyltransferase [Aureitalea marina]
MLKLNFRSLLVLIALLSQLPLIAQSTFSDPYQYRNGSYDGTGKWYMGREIAHVMGYQGMAWLERAEREKEEQTTTLIANMNIQPEDVIADIGAGSGYHVFKMAPLANKGMVYAVDIQIQMLTAIKARKDAGGFDNVQGVKGEIEGVNLPKNSVDKVLIVDVYHEMSHPVEMMRSIRKAMRPDAQLFLIEYREEDASVPIKPLHKMSEAQAVKEMRAAGFRLKENMGNLPWQHCMVFVLDGN